MISELTVEGKDLSHSEIRSWCNQNKTKLMSTNTTFNTNYKIQRQIAKGAALPSRTAKSYCKSITEKSSYLDITCSLQNSLLLYIKMFLFWDYTSLIRFLTGKEKKFHKFIIAFSFRKKLFAPFGKISFSCKRNKNIKFL